MTLVLELSPEEKAIVAEAAAQSGIDVGTAATRAVVEWARTQQIAPDVARDLAILKDIAAMAAKWTAETPPLSDDATSSVNDERGLTQL